MISKIGGYKMKKKFLSSLIVAFMLFLTGCSGSWLIINGVTYNTPILFSMRYERFNGNKERSITVDANETLIITVTVETVSGLLDAYIAKDNNTDDCSYQGNDIQTTSFTVTLSQAGRYTIRVDADNHRGSFSFNWE